MGSSGSISSRVRTARLVTLLFAALLLAACGGSTQASAPPSTDEPTGAVGGGPPATNLTAGCIEDFQAGVDYLPDEVEFDHAEGVEVTYGDHYKLVEVTIPYADADTPPFRVVLNQCGAPAPELGADWADAQVIEVPAEEVITLTTVNLPHLAELGAVDALVGVGTGAFVSTPAVAERVEAGELPDFADGTGTPDAERIIGAGPDLLIMDAFGETLLDDVRRFVSAGVPTVINADFNEPTPLGRAEWVKFTALFLNREVDATVLFDRIVEDYEQTAALAATADERPLVLLDQPYEGTWYAPGGASFPAQLVADAGGRYVFADHDQPGSLTLDIETVLAEGRDADIWIGVGSVHGTLDDLRALDSRFAEFRAFQRGAVWAADAFTTPGGGNALYEEGVLRPDLILADLVAILHPDLLPDHELRYYGPVGEAG